MAVVGAIGAGLVTGLGAHADAPPDAASTLRAAQRAVAHTQAFAYELYGESRVWEGPKDAAVGRTVTTRYRGSGASVGEVARQKVDDGTGPREILRAHSTLYRRAIASAPGNEPWDGYEYRSTALARHVDELRAATRTDADTLALAVELYLGGAEADGNALADIFEGGTPTGDPDGFREAISELQRPQVTARRNGVTTLTAVVQPDPAFGDTVPDGTIELDVGADDLPRALRLHVMTDHEDEVVVDVHFTH